MRSYKNIEIKDNESYKIVWESRRGVVAVNRLLVLLSLIISPIVVYLWGWLLMPVVLVFCYIFSIINSVRAANKVKNIHGLSHSEQEGIWNKIKSSIARR